VGHGRIDVLRASRLSGDLPGNAVIHGDVGHFIDTNGFAILVRNIRDEDVEVFKALEGVHDPRVQSGAPFSHGRVRRPWGPAVSESTEVKLLDWPVPGPRTVQWCIEWLERRNTTPLAHHRWFVNSFGVKNDHFGIDAHSTAMRVLEELIVYDGVNVANLAGVEILMRKAQLTEYVYHMDSLGLSEKAGKGAAKGNPSAGVSFTGLLDEAAIFTGLTKDTGTVMVAPSLLDHVAGEVQRDAAILKQVRKAREERKALSGSKQ
jgi:hypothetical protein